MQGHLLSIGRACLRPLENFLRDPKPQKIANFRIFAPFGGSNSLLKMKIFDVWTSGDDSDSLIYQITPKLFFSFSPMSWRPEESKIIFETHFSTQLRTIFFGFINFRQTLFLMMHIYTPWILNFKKSLGRPRVPNFDMLYPFITPKTFARSQPMSWGCLNIKKSVQKFFWLSYESFFLLN